MVRKNSRATTFIFGVVLIISMNFFTFVNHSEALTQKQIDTKVNIMTDGKEFDMNRVIVKYKEKANILGKVMSKDGKVMAQVLKVKENENTKQNHYIQKENIKKLLKTLLLDPNVEYAEPNYLGHTAGWTPSGVTTKPDDYSEANHWYYTQGKVKEMWYDQGCPGGADCGGDSNVIVAVIDTGLAFEAFDDTGEEGFTDYLWDNGYGYYDESNVWHQYGVDNGKNFTAIGIDYNLTNGFKIYTNIGETPNDGLDNDCNGIIDDHHGFDAYAWKPKQDSTPEGEWYYWVPDYYSENFCNTGVPDPTYNGITYPYFKKMGHPVDTLGHGSFVTGNISGIVDNTAGSVSPAQNITIMPIAANITFVNGFYSTEVLSGIYYAVENGADVINMSLGGFGFSQAMQDAVSFAYDNGVVVVAASGNGNEAVSYPAALDDVIAVGAVNPDNSRSSYSNYGSQLDIVAYVGDSPSGYYTYQETLSCGFSCNSSSTFNATANSYGIGTSFASPQVAAAAALVKSHFPAYTAAQITGQVLYNSTDINTAGWDTFTGHGVLNFQNLLDTIVPSNTPTVTPTPTETPIPTPTYSSFFPFYATNNATPQSNTWIIVGNPSATENVNTIVDIAGLINQQQQIAPGTKGIFYFPNTVNGPATVNSDKPVYVTQRELFGDSFNEYESIDSTSLSTKFYFPFYATNGTTSNTWIIIGNPADATNSADITVKVAGVVKGTDTINPGEKSVQYYPNTIDGPVEVSSDQPIYVTQRELFGNSFNEYKGLDASNLSQSYYFPFYATNGTTSNTWVIVGNPANAINPANITVRIAGVVKGTDTINPGEKSIQYFPSTIDGPVEVISDENVYVTQRELFGNSFNEYEGIDANSLANHYYFPFYATNTSNNPANNTWVIIGNPGLVDAHVTVKVGGVVKSTPTILPGEKSSQYFPNLIDGPVEIISDENVYVTQRELFGNSFNEYPGISL